MGINKSYDLTIDPVANITANQAALQTITRTIPAVGNIQDIFLEMTNLVAANFQFIRLRANNILIQEVSGPDLDLMNQQEGLPASTAAPGNDVLCLSQRRNRALGGGLQSLANTPDGLRLITGSPKDLEQVCGLNCGVKDAAGNQIATVQIEIGLVDTPVGTSSIKITANTYDPFPGGPGLVKFIDLKTFNASTGVNVLDKNTAYNVGDGLRLNLDKIVYIPDDPTMTLDDWVHYYNNIPIKNRTNNLNAFIRILSGLNTNQAGAFIFDTRELLYGDEDLFIGDTKQQFRTQVTVAVATGNLKVYQHSMGTLFPTVK